MKDLGASIKLGLINYDPKISPNLEMDSINLMSLPLDSVAGWIARRLDWKQLYLAGLTNGLNRDRYLGARILSQIGFGVAES